MNNYTLNRTKTEEEFTIFDKKLNKIFEAHYFSNHYQFAIALEEKLESITTMANNITYMNSSIALVSLLKIIAPLEDKSVNIGYGVSLFDWVISGVNYLNLNKQSIENMDSEGINIILDIEDFLQISVDQLNPLNTIVIPTSLKVRKGFEKFPHVFDMSSETVYGMDTGAFVALNYSNYADKLRWMRSSYGRTGENIDIPVKGNGRFSELQAAQALAAIESDAIISNELLQFNVDMNFCVNKINECKFYSSDYISGILEIQTRTKEDEKQAILNNFRTEIQGNKCLIYVPIQEGLNNLQSILT